MAKYIVYLTTNLKSKISEQYRKYIGVHRTSNPDVFDGYIGCGVNIYKPSTYMFPKTPFQYAVKKYGTDAFKTETLFIFDTPEEALKKEEELVDDIWINQSWTYNTLKGGGGYKVVWKNVYQFTLEGELIKKWDSCLELSDFFGDPINRFYNAIYSHRSLIGYYWAYEEKIDVKKYSNNRLKHPVHLYDNSGKYLCEFESRKECAEFLGCNPQSVSNAIRSQHSIKDHFVSDTIVDEYIPKPTVRLKGTTFYVYNKDKEFVGKFVGKEIIEGLQVHSWKKIYSAMNENLGWYKDYYISTTPVYEVPDKKYRRTKSIEVYTKQGEFIEKFNSVKELTDKYNLTFGELDRIMKGIKYCENYIFVYSK